MYNVNKKAAWRWSIWYRWYFAIWHQNNKREIEHDDEPFNNDRAPFSWESTCVFICSHQWHLRVGNQCCVVRWMDHLGCDLPPHQSHWFFMLLLLLSFRDFRLNAWRKANSEYNHNSLFSWGLQFLCGFIRENIHSGRQTVEKKTTMNQKHATLTVTAWRLFSVHSKWNYRNATKI